MGKIIIRKNLSSEQYRRANFVMSTILVLSYLVYIVVEIMNANKGAIPTDTFVRCGVYACVTIATFVIYKLTATKKICMILFSAIFLITYGVLVFGNGVVVMVLVFPVLIGLMSYLNSAVVIWGTIGTLIIGAVKCISVKGDSELFNYAILIMVGFVLCIYGTFKAILLLIAFSREDQAVIEQEAEHRAVVAAVVAESVEKLNGDFKEVIVALDEIQDAMRTADMAMGDIASNSENTASAVSHQADMTSHIQERLENTNDLTNNAKTMTEDLKNIIVNGKQLADDLQVQSNMVDQNITRISKTVEMLVNSVQQVSGITESILNISTQTNLLALNASIEAARAGESGRGFAVVAEEIRKLAEETKDSTEKITAIISKLASVTDDTQAGIEESADSIEAQRMKVNQVNESFSEVEKGMVVLGTNVVNMSQEVASVMEANAKIVESISTLSSSSEEVSAGTTMCRETIDASFENLEEFAAKVNGAFEQLQILNETVAE